MMLAASSALSRVSATSDVLDLSGRTFAELIAISQSGLLDGKPVVAPDFDSQDLISLLSRDLILRPASIGLTDDIHTLQDAIAVLLRPVESPWRCCGTPPPLSPSPARPSWNWRRDHS